MQSYRNSVFMVCVCALVHVLFLGDVHFSLANDEHFIYDSKGKRDPFIPLMGRNVRLTDVELLESIKDVKVEGIIIDNKRGSAAIINGQIMRVGEFMGGFRLDTVTPYTVVLSRDGKQYELQYRNKQDDEPVL